MAKWPWASLTAKNGFGATLMNACIHGWRLQRTGIMVSGWRKVWRTGLPFGGWPLVEGWIAVSHRLYVDVVHGRVAGTKLNCLTDHYADHMRHVPASLLVKNRGRSRCG